MAETAAGPAESLQREAGEDGFTLEHLLSGEDETERVLERVSLREAIDRLPERERRVISLRYFHDMTQEAAARVLASARCRSRALSAAPYPPCANCWSPSRARSCGMLFYFWVPMQRRASHEKTAKLRDGCP